MNKQLGLSCLVFAVLVMALTPGCEVGVNPLLFDGAPVEFTATAVAPSPVTSFSASGTADLQDIMQNISNALDSIKVFNITITIENVGQMPLTTTLSGSGSFNDSTVVTFTNVPLSELLAEKSIFHIPGFTSNVAGVLYMANSVNEALQNSDTPAPATFSVYGSSSTTPINFKVKFKVYTQVYTSS